MTRSPEVVGLIAGGRQFPLLVARGVKAAGHTLVAAAFSGHSNLDVAAEADVFRELKLGQLGKLIDFFKQNGVTRVVMAGTIDKPKAMDLRHLDMRALKLVFKRRDKGDDALLRMLTREFEAEGMPVAPAHVYMPSLLTPEGVLSRRAPDGREMADIRMAVAAARTLGRLDIGQCVVLREGIVAAVEALEGTDAAIERGCSLGGPGCVVVKVFKPGQEERMDLPSVGPDTVRTMARGQASCLAVEAGKSLFFDRDEALAEADKAGIAVYGFTGDLGPEPESI
jgi:DUF1009 family protein